MRKILREITVLAAFTAAFVVAATPASASESTDIDTADASSIADLVTELLPSATGESCVHPLIENPFEFLGDTFDYVLAPDGSFEGIDGDGWLLGDGAGPVAGNDPFPLRAEGADANVLALPAGSSAVSAPMCVDLNYPHFRMAVNQLPNEKGKYKGKLRVETMYPNSKKPQWRKVGMIRPATGGWAVSDFIDLEPERGGTLPGGRQVSLRFSVQGEDGNFQIDDVYIDPRFRV